MTSGFQSKGLRRRSRSMSLSRQNKSAGSPLSERLRKTADVAHSSRLHKSAQVARSSRLHKSAQVARSSRLHKSAQVAYSSRLRKSVQVAHTPRLRRAYAEGRLAAACFGGGNAPADSKRLQLLLNESWTRCSKYRGGTRLTDSMLREGQSFSEGFMDALHAPRQVWLPVPLLKSASAVVLACGGMIAADVLQELVRLPLQEIIVVADGWDASTLVMARSHPGVTIVHISQEIGDDAGRSLGAKLNGSEIMLFVDGRRRIGAEYLAHYLNAIDGGADIALNDVTGRLGSFRQWDDLSRVRAFMNWSLGRPDLGANSVTALPHAWSHESLKAIGTSALAVPALAQQAAIGHKLRFVACPCDRSNPIEAAAADAVGDHFEALQAAMQQQGNRLDLPDRVRRRSIAGGGWQ
ncbi:hypothetical protein [Paenibacillus plantiphilus]|nr:hypothetical protein [Paenibacillus plantiphilus]